MEPVEPADNAWDDNAWDDNAWDDNAWDDNAWDDNAWDDNAWDDNAWDDNAWDDNAWDDNAWDAAFAAIVADGPHDTGPSDDGAPNAALLDDTHGLALVRALRDVDPARLDASDAVSYLVATERAIAWLSSLQSTVLVSIAGPRSRTDHYEVETARVISIEDADRSEIAAATRWSEPWAHERIATARLLAGPLAETAVALADGAITSRHADAICAAVQRMAGYDAWTDGADLADPADPVVRSFLAACTELEDAVLEGARRRGVAATRRSAERAVARIDAAGARRRLEAAQRSRDVYLVPEPDGMALLVARMGLAQAMACLSVIDGVARDPRLPLPADLPGNAGIGERRADALTQLVLHGSQRASGSPTAPAWAPTAVRTHVDVVIDLMSLVGLAEQPGTIRGHGPGGPEPLAAEVIRALVAADESATMRRLVADPLTGHLLDRGRSTYAVPSTLRDFVVTRDGTCRFPGCARRAGLAQIDHAIPWERGGTSDRANLGALCIRHHQLKTHAGWTITASAEDGSASWRFPAGRDYAHSPPRLQSRE